MLIPFDNRGRFTADIAVIELEGLALRGVGNTTVVHCAAILLQLGSGAVLGRLLTPSDFGVITLVTTFSLLLLNASGNGLTEVAIQRKGLNHELASNLFWIALATGVVCAALLIVAGPLIARTFREPRAIGVSLALAVSVGLTSVSVIHRALLMRAMWVSAANGTILGGRLAWTVTAVVLSSCGWGYWALAAAATSQAALESLMAFHFCRWKPSLPGCVNGTGSATRTALTVYGRFSLNYFARNLDNALIAWKFDAQTLGYYKKAYDLFAFSSFLSSFSSVALAALSRAKENEAQYRRFVLSTIGLASILGLGLGGLLILTGRDLIRMLLGPQWAVAGDVFVAFAPGVSATFIYGVHGWFHLSSGHSVRWLRWGVVEFVVLGTAMLIGVSWGAIGVATASSAAWWILLVPGLWYSARPVGLSVGELLGRLWRPSVASVLATVLVLSLQAVTEGGWHRHWQLRLVVTTLIFVPLYLLGLIVTHGNMSPVRQIARLLMAMWRKPTVPMDSPSVIDAIRATRHTDAAAGEGRY